MNLQHERIQTLCESLNLPFIAQGYPVAAQQAAQQESAYSDFLENLLKMDERSESRVCSRVLPVSRRSRR